MDEKYLQGIYDEMKGSLDLGSFGSFKSMIASDPNFRKSFFGEASSKLDLGDYNSFEKMVSPAPASGGAKKNVGEPTGGVSGIPTQPWQSNFGQAPVGQVQEAPQEKTEVTYKETVEKPKFGPDRGVWNGNNSFYSPYDTPEKGPDYDENLDPYISLKNLQRSPKYKSDGIAQGGVEAGPLGITGLSPAVSKEYSDAADELKRATGFLTPEFLEKNPWVALTEGNKSNSIQELRMLHSKDPQLFNQRVAASSVLYQAMKEGKQKEVNQYLQVPLDPQGWANPEELARNVSGVRGILNGNKAVDDNIATAFSGALTADNPYIKSEWDQGYGKKLGIDNIYQYAALRNLQITNPRAYKYYTDILSSDIKKNGVPLGAMVKNMELGENPVNGGLHMFVDEAAGKQRVLDNLQEIGKSDIINKSYRLMNSISDSDPDREQKAKALQGVVDQAKSGGTFYNLVHSNKTEKGLRDFEANDYSYLNGYMNKIFGKVKNGLAGIIENTFGSTNPAVEIGRGMREEAADAPISARRSGDVVRPDSKLYFQWKAIYDSNLPQDEKMRRYRQAALEHPDDLQTYSAEDDNSASATAGSIVHGGLSMISDVAGYGLSSAAMGGGTVGTMMSIGLDAQQESYKELLMSGDPDALKKSQMYGAAAAAVAMAGDATGALKNFIPGKMTKTLMGITEEGWDIIGRTGVGNKLAGLRAALKESGAEAAKVGFMFGGGQTFANAVVDQANGEDVDWRHVTNTAIASTANMIGSSWILLLHSGYGAYQNATSLHPQEKASLYFMAAKPEFSKAYADLMHKTGKIDDAKFELINQSIDKLAEINRTAPEYGKSGKLSEQDRMKYVTNEFIKQMAKEKRSGAPAPVAEKLKAVEEKMDYKNSAILSREQNLAKAREQAGTTEPQKAKPVSSVDELKDRNDWAIITATRESVGAHDHPDNIAANEELRKELEEKYHVEPLQGKYNNEDQGASFLVSGISKEEAMELGRKYGQESVLTNEGNVYSDGSGVNKTNGDIITGEEAKLQPGFSVSDKLGPFSLSIDWENKTGINKDHFDKAYEEEVGSVRSENYDFAAKLARRLQDAWKKVVPGLEVNIDNYNQAIKDAFERGDIDKEDYETAQRANGWFDDKTDKIYLNPARIQMDTPAHEFGHLWTKMVKARYPELWGRALHLAKEFHDEKGDFGLGRSYSKNNWDSQAEEWIVKQLGQAGRDIARTRKGIRDFVTDFWDAIKQVLGIKKDVDISNLTIDQLINLGAKDIVTGGKVFGLDKRQPVEGAEENAGIAAQSAHFQIDEQERAREIEDIVSEAKKAGTYLKAPNGKNTMLQPHQWAQVRTSAFKNWFGDWEKDPANASKVVDANGEPLVLYTGTSKDVDFKKFNIPKNGAWFTTDPETASMYAKENDSQGVKYDHSTGKYSDTNTQPRVFPVYINARRIGDFNTLVTPEQREKLRYADNYKKMQGLYFQNIYFDKPVGQRTQAIWYDRGHTVLVVLEEASQIKSATGNSGAFDKSNPDIRFQVEDHLSEMEKNDVENRVVAGRRVSTRIPSGKKTAPADAHSSSNYTVGLEEARKEPKNYMKNAQIVSGYEMMSGVDKSDVNSIKKALKKGATPKDIAKGVEASDRIYNSFVRSAADNLKWLFGHFNEQLRNISHRWYDGANVMAQDYAQKYDVSLEQSSAAIAVLSPQKDWYQNVSLAERVIDIFKNKADFVFDQKMADKMAEIAGGAKKPGETAAEYRKRKAEEQEEARVFAPKMIGRKIGELGDLRSRAIRIYDETYNDRSYNVLSPNGDVISTAVTDKGKNAKVAWSSYPFIDKAISVIEDGSIENISRNLGKEHKVRNFYNNIVDPTADKGDVTIDTHAVAAATLKPLANKDTEVKHSMSGPGTIETGLTGTYSALADAYRLAAKESGVSPRQMQSITWEAVRGLFTDTFKTKENKAAVNEIWRKFADGKLNLDETRRAIDELAGGVEKPSWARRRGEASDNVGEANNAGELPKHGVAGDGRGAGRRDAEDVEAGMVSSSAKFQLPEKWNRHMTEEGDSYVFFHYSDKDFDRVDPSKFGKNTKLTGRDENPGVGMTMFYTRPDMGESGLGNHGYYVKVPKDQVYPFNKDPLNLYDKAEAEFRKDYGQYVSFDPNKQLGYITKLAAKEGFPITVAEWGIGGKKALRAQTTEKLPVKKFREPLGGNAIKTYKEFTPNSRKKFQIDEQDIKKEEDSWSKNISDSTLDSIVRSLRTKDKNGAVVGILSEVNNRRKDPNYESQGDDYETDELINHLAENGVTLNNISNLLIHEGVVDDKREARRYLTEIGGVNGRGLRDEYLKFSVDDDAYWQQSRNFARRMLRDGANYHELVNYLQERGMMREEAEDVVFEAQHMNSKDNTLIGLSRDAINTVRRENNLEALTKSGVQSEDQWWKAGVDMVNGKPNAAQGIIDRLKKKPQAATPEEVAALTYESVTLHNELIDHQYRMENARSQEERDAAFLAYNVINAKINDIHEITVNVIHPYAGRALRALQMLRRLDYTAVNYESIYKSVYGTSDVPKEVRARIKKLEDDRANAISDLELSEKKVAQLKLNYAMEVEFSKATSEKPSEPKSKKSPTRSDWRDRSADWWGKSTTKKFSVDDMPKEAKAGVKEYFKALVAEGHRDMEEIVNIIHEDVIAPNDPTITKRDVMDIISGYGKLAEKDTSPEATAARDLKEQMRLESALSDVKNGLLPLRSGYQRDKPSHIAREKRQELEDLMRRNGIVHPQTEAQYTSALEAEKNRVRNRIEDLKRMEKEGKRNKRENVSLVADDELTALRNERRTLQKRVDKLLGRSGLTDAQKISAIESMYERLLNDKRDRIAQLNLDRKSNPDAVTSEKIERLKADYEHTKAEYDKMLKEHGEIDARRAEAAIDAVEKRIKDKREKLDKVKKLDEEKANLKSELEKVKKNKDNAERERIEGRIIEINDERDSLFQKKKRDVKQDIKEAIAKAEKDNDVKKVENLKKSLRRIEDAEKEVLNKRIAQNDSEYEFEKLKAKWMEDGKGIGEWTRQLVLNLHRNALLSSLQTQGKLTFAAAFLMMQRPIKAIPDAVVNFMFPVLSSKSPGHWRNSGSGAGSAFNLVGGHGVSKSGAKYFFSEGDLARIMHGKKSKFDSEFGVPKVVVDELGAYFGKTHALAKYFPKTLSEGISFERRLRWLGDNGYDVNDTATRMMAHAGAVADGLNAIFMGDNKVTDAYRGLIRTLRMKDKNGIESNVNNGIANVLEWMFPVVKIPTNIARAQYEMLPGIGMIDKTSLFSNYYKDVLKNTVSAHKDGAGWYDSYRKGLKEAASNLTPAQADVMVGLLKKQLFGAVLFSIGAFFPSAFGGFGDEDKDIPKDKMKVFGVLVPKWMVHTPALSILQIGAAWRRLHAQAEEDDMWNRWGRPALVPMAEVASEVPFASQITDVVGALKGISKEGAHTQFNRYMGKQAASFIPSDVSKYAKGYGPYTNEFFGAASGGQLGAVVGATIGGKLFGPMGQRAGTWAGAALGGTLGTYAAANKESYSDDKDRLAVSIWENFTASIPGHGGPITGRLDLPEGNVEKKAKEEITKRVSSGDENISDELKAKAGFNPDDDTQFDKFVEDTKMDQKVREFRDASVEKKIKMWNHLTDLQKRDVEEYIPSRFRLEHDIKQEKPSVLKSHQDVYDEFWKIDN